MATTTKKTTEKSSEKYIEAVGRRKTAIARVRITASQKPVMTINDRTLEAYFTTESLRLIAMEALKNAPSFSVSAHIIGGGISGQAEALRHGIARALIKHDHDLRKDLKHSGFLKRDPRAKERRKFGLRKARKAPQWSKR